MMVFNKYAGLLCGVTMVITCSVLYSSGNLIRKINLENLVTGQLNQELKQYLPVKSYAVFTSIQLKTVKGKELIEGEVITDNPIDDDEKPELPGFEVLPDFSKRRSSERKRESYEFVARDELSSVDIKVLLSDQLLDEAISTAKLVVLDKVQSSFGNIATVNFLTSSFATEKLPELEPEKTPLEKVTSIFTVYWPYLLVSLLVLLLIWLLVRLFQYKPEKKPHEPALDQKQPDDPPPPSQQYSDEFLELLRRQTLQEVVDEFAKEVVREPFISRKFLSQLREDDQKNIHLSLQTHPLRSLFSQYFSLPPLTQEDVDDTDLKDKLSRLKATVGELKNYQTIGKLRLQNPFGLLSFFTDVELKKLFENKSCLDIFAMLDHLTKEQMQGAIQGLDNDEKVRLITMLQNSETLVPQQKKEIVTKLQEELRDIVSAFKAEFSNKQTMVGVAMDALQDDEEKLRTVLDENPGLQSNYSYYLRTMEDVLNLEAPTIQRGIEQTSNDSLARVIYALDDEVQQEKFLTFIPDIRRDIINSLLLTLQDDDKDTYRADVLVFKANFKKDFQASFKEKST